MMMYVKQSKRIGYSFSPKSTLTWKTRRASPAKDTSVCVCQACHLCLQFEVLDRVFCGVGFQFLLIKVPDTPCRP